MNQHIWVFYLLIHLDDRYAQKANLKYADQMVCGVAMVELFSDMELSNTADR